MSDFTRYSRLSAWLGAGALLVESVLGHSVGAITLAAVLLLGIGFVCFLVGLVVDARVPAARLLVPDAPPPYQVESEARTEHSRIVHAPSAVEQPAAVTGTARGVAGPSQRPAGRSKKVTASAPEDDARVTPVRRPKFRERGKMVDRTVAPSRVGESDAPDEAAVPSVTETGPHVRTGVATAVEANDDHMCPKCDSSIALGQFVAHCPVCGATHHAGCWVEHRFSLFYS